MNHPNTGPAATSRLRPSRAPSKPPRERGGRLARVMRQPITYADRERIERDLELLIDLLNALDGDPDLDGGKGDDDCCPAGDDDPARSDRSGMGGLGDADDAENSGDECEPSDANDYMGDRLVTVHGGVPA